VGVDWIILIEVYRPCIGGSHGDFNSNTTREPELEIVQLTITGVRCYPPTHLLGSCCPRLAVEGGGSAQTEVLVTACMRRKEQHSNTSMVLPRGRKPLSGVYCGQA